MNEKITWRKNGTVRAECRFEEFEPVTDYGIAAGEECCLGISATPAGSEGVVIRRDTDGIEGNSGSQRRLHGWRGTTNGYSVHAHGWRSVLETGNLKRGRGVYIVFSADKKPDEA